MDNLDTLYRALAGYRKETLENHELEVERNAVARADVDFDKLEITRTVCTVEDDWIEEIEKGLVWVEKAIAEERQFIRTNGEIVPIEKVKRVGKESVEHLSRHSNMITRKPEEGATLIPDELYTVERLSDFAVYENRFLFMMLTYLRDFISLRYDKIVELCTTYDGKMQMKKSVHIRKQKLTYEMVLANERRDDEYLREHNECAEQIKRIDMILKAVIHYLGTPLMVEVSKTPMLKPPITKTNVLKMNQNFKHAVALYDYIVAYEKPGYTAETKVKTFSPLMDNVADEFSESVVLTSFLTYKHGLGIEKHLRNRFEIEEQRRKEVEQQKFLDKIKSLRRRIRESGENPEEYMLLLEKRLRQLETESAELVIAKKEIERLTLENASLVEDKRVLTTENDELKKEAIEREERHAQEIVRLNEDHAYEVSKLNDDHAYELKTVNEKHAQEIENLGEEHRQEVERIHSVHEQLVTGYNERIIEANNEAVKAREECDARIEEEKQKAEARIIENNEECHRKIMAAQAVIAQKEEETHQAIEEAHHAEEIRLLAMARVNALSYEMGKHSDQDFTEEYAFEELEREYRVMQRLFKEQWGKTKKRIRKETFEKIFGRKSDKNEIASSVSSEEELRQSRFDFAEMDYEQKDSEDDFNYDFSNENEQKVESDDER